ncbi:hypothetical protein BYT27DRAFT_7219699 [Phlegmacium glaucopus]|nr:hypothetical protein BYT27DRAFT_7219699 [Phlegmacium glaucopus]
MPMHTRSMTKELEKGGYAFSSLSDTGEGIHTRFVYDNCYDSDPESKAVVGLSNSESLASFNSSLSSISSGSASDQSDSSMFDGTLSSIPSSSFVIPNSSAWDSCHNLQFFGNPNASASDNNTLNAPRPLQRASAQRWVRDSESGELFRMSEGEFWPSVPETSSGPSEDADDYQQIFDREFQAMIAAAGELRKEMTPDQLQMLDNADWLPGVEEDPQEAPQVASGSSGRPLSSEKTELIDETFRPPPGELGVYPQQWVTYQSTVLQRQPTELIADFT